MQNSSFLIQTSSFLHCSAVDTRAATTWTTTTASMSVSARTPSMERAFSTVISMSVWNPPVSLHNPSFLVHFWSISGLFLAECGLFYAGHKRRRYCRAAVSPAQSGALLGAGEQSEKRWSSNERRWYSVERWWIYVKNDNFTQNMTGAEDPVAPFPGATGSPRGSNMNGCKYEEDIFTNFTLAHINKHEPVTDGPMLAFHAAHSIHTPLETLPEAFEHFAFIEDSGERCSDIIFNKNFIILNLKSIIFNTNFRGSSGVPLDGV